MEPPEWMTKLFFEKALRNYEKDDNAVITTFHFIPIKKSSRNLYSAIFRVKLCYKTLRHKKSGDKVLMVVIKIPVLQQVEFSEEFIKEAPLFKTEMNMYNRSLIDVDQVLAASGIRPTLFPKVIYISQDPKAIVLKDIETDEFFDAKLPPDNLEDSKVIFKRLAKFHAASYFLTEQLYMDLSSFSYSVYQADHYVENVLRNTLRAFKTSMLNWEDLNEKYVEKIDYLIDNIARIGTKFYSGSKPHQGYSVLNHGDCHLGNMMLKYDKNGKIEDVCFIDFQLAIYASPAVDLMHCFSVLTEENKDQHFDEIVAYYHSEFVDMLKSMGFLKPPPSLLDLHIELLRYGILATIIGICFIPQVLVGKYLSEEDYELEGLDFKKKIFESKDYQRIIKKELDRMLRKGFI